MSSSTWTFGPGGVYTAVWDGVDTLTVTLTATGAFVESFSGQSLPLLLPNLLQFPQVPALGSIISGQLLCPPSQYAPATSVTLSTTSATLAAVSSANVNTGSFTAPQSGSVIVQTSLVANSTSADVVSFALAPHGSVTPAGDVLTFNSSSITNELPTLLEFFVTGLTPGAVYNFDLLFAIAAAGTLAVHCLGQNSTTPTGTSGVPANPVVTKVLGV